MEIEHKKNTAKYLVFPMVSSTSPENFVSGETVTDTAYYKDGAGAWTSLSITDTVSEIASTGLYEIDLTAAELNHDQVIIKMTSTNAADSAYIFKLKAQEVDDLNITALGNIGIDWANVENPTTAVDLAGTDIQLCDTVTTLSNLPTIPTNWLTADGLAADAGTEIGTAVWATTTRVLTAGTNLNDLSTSDIFTYAIEGAETFEQQMRLMRAESCGKVAVSGATVTFRNAADDADRITATTDSNGQRTAVTVVST